MPELPSDSRQFELQTPPSLAGADLRGVPSGRRLQERQAVRGSQPAVRVLRTQLSSFSLTRLRYSMHSSSTRRYSSTSTSRSEQNIIRFPSSRKLSSHSTTCSSLQVGSYRRIFSSSMRSK